MTGGEVFGHLRELGREAVRRGGTTFTVDPSMFWYPSQFPLLRKGFNFRDELEHFCWIYGCIYCLTETRIGLCFTVRVPDSLLWEYWLERLSETTEWMERYA